MTSIRPSPKRFASYQAVAENDAPGIMTLNTLLKEDGYYTISNGKVFHNLEDNAHGWSEPAWRPGTLAAGLPAPGKGGAKKGSGKGEGKSRGDERISRGVPFEISALSDDELGDGQVALKTISDLGRLKEQGQPFFLAAGFFKPHLPFIAPKKYWDLYPEKAIHLPANYHPPKDAPAESIHTSGELRSYDGVPKSGPLPDALALNLIRGYHACVSFTDAQIGRILDELDRLDLAKNTIVILWGDHGWNLGEHTLWCKHSCYEISMRVPLLIHAPGFEGGMQTNALTELIDIYPTLCELAGVPVPAHVQGRSFVPLMREPALPWKDEAIGRFTNGDTIRTDHFRFTEYTDRQRGPVARMMYDHRIDPDENTNISERPAHGETTTDLTARLRSGKGKDEDLPLLANSEPTNAEEAAAKKEAEMAAVDAKYEAWVATLIPAHQAWEKVLQENLGGFYMPIHKKEKVEGRANAWDYVEDDPALPRVLLIGDSVSRGYTMSVREGLAGKANVHRAPANCGPTKQGLEKLDVWLGAGKWDVIHFNFGIHDRATPLPDYRKRLLGIVDRLGATGATLIWATTTPVPDTTDKKYTSAPIIDRNALAAGVMAEEGIQVNDLFVAITPHLAEMQNPNDVHFNREGYRFLGGKVASFIAGVLDSTGPRKQE